MDVPLKGLALVEARDFLNVHEREANRGPGVEWIQEHASIPPGSPWCAAFTLTAIEIAAAKKDVECPVRAVNREGYVQDWVDWASDEGRLIPAHRAEAGDLFALHFPEKSRFAHIGFVVRVQSGGDPKKFVTVGGNTNEAGEREGVKVHSRIRRVDQDVIFFDWT